MNGKPHDHPLSDILNHKIEMYGTQADELVRKIAALSSRRELDEWWEREIGGNPDRKTLLQNVEARHAALDTRAKERGWEVNE